MNEALFQKAKEVNPSLTEAEFEAKRADALAKADATGRALEGKVSVGGMVMEATPAEGLDIAKDLE